MDRRLSAPKHQRLRLSMNGQTWGEDKVVVSKDKKITLSSIFVNNKRIPTVAKKTLKKDFKKSIDSTNDAVNPEAVA